MFEGITEEIGRGVIAEVAKATADALVTKGIIPLDDHDKFVGSVNYLGDAFLQAYLAGKL